MKNKNQVLNAGIWYIIGNMLLKGIFFLTLPIFTRILRTEDYGYYNTYMAYELIITGIIGLGLYGSVKNAKIDFEKSFNSYVSSILFLGLMVFCTVIIVANGTFRLYAGIFGFDQFVLNILIAHAFGSFVMQICNAKFNMEFKYKSFILIAGLSILSNIIFSILLIFFVFQNQRYMGRIIGYAMPSIVIGIILLTITFIKGKGLFNKVYWKYGLLIGLPLVPHILSQTILSQFDRIMIRNMVGVSESGIYSFVYTMSTILYIIHISIEAAWTPWLFYRMRVGEREVVREKSKHYITAFAMLTVGFMCVFPEIIKIMAAQDYWTGMGLTIPLTLCIYCIFLYTLPVNIEYFHKKTFFISIGTVGATIINIVLNYFCIKMFSYEVVAYTTLLSYIFLFLFHYSIAKRWGFQEYYSIKHIILVSLIVFTIAGLLICVKGNILARYAIVFLVLVGCILKRKIFIDIFKEVKKEKNS